MIVDHILYMGGIKENMHVYICSLVDIFISTGICYALLSAE